MKDRDSKLGAFFGILGEILAVVMVLVFVLLLVNAQFQFIPVDSALAKALDIIKVYGGISLALLIGGKATFRFNWLVRIIYLLLAAVVIVFMCFPATYTYLVNLIPAA